MLNWLLPEAYVMCPSESHMPCLHKTFALHLSIWNFLKGVIDHLKPVFANSDPRLDTLNRLCRRMTTLTKCQTPCNQVKSRLKSRLAKFLVGAHLLLWRHIDSWLTFCLTATLVTSLWQVYVDLDRCTSTKRHSLTDEHSCEVFATILVFGRNSDWKTCFC